MRALAVFLSILLAAPLAYAGKDKKKDEKARKPVMVSFGNGVKLPSAGMTEATDKEDKTSFEFRVYPRILAITPGHFNFIFVHVRVVNPGEKFYCLGVSYEVGGVNREPSFRSERQDLSCPPYSEVVHYDNDAANYSPDLPLKYVWDGSNPVQVRVVLYNGKDPVKVMVQRLVVTGVNVPSEAPDPTMPGLTAPEIQ